jgi:hypothetical protein
LGFGPLAVSWLELWQTVELYVPNYKCQLPDMIEEGKFQAVSQLEKRLHISSPIQILCLERRHYTARFSIWL